MNSLQSAKQAFKNPQLRKYMKGNYMVENCTDSGSGVSAGDLVIVSSNEVATATDDSAAVLGISRGGITAGEAGDIEYGHVPVKLATSITKLDEFVSRVGGYAGKAIASQTTILSATAGGNFGNQPAGDAVDVVSDNAADLTQTATIYGTVTGATDTITSETVVINGTTGATTTETTWQNIVGVELSASCAGTVTISENSGSAAITTITTGNTTAGIVAATTNPAFGAIPRHDASGASTSPVGLVGTDLTGAALTSVDALNGTTEEDHGTAAFSTVTRIMLGAVASTVNVTVLSAAADSNKCGIALETGSTGDVIDAYVKPYFY